ncbi:hypothetical protein [Endozoicomonas sp. ISHI1]|uniref:hypothetical protein n=1 Tax=Endozoicomonas sp. ISHI1 TaxID=2825882 RepID=UPI002148B428|nr:hypothetical protein [Endozoicomonas sp. ISHI1]
MTRLQSLLWCSPEMAKNKDSKKTSKQNHPVGKPLEHPPKSQALSKDPGIPALAAVTKSRNNLNILSAWIVTSIPVMAFVNFDHHPIAKSLLNGR